jgi:phosphatidate cytidylyltransferase
MLKQRILTALLMMAVLIPAVFYPDPVVFGVVAAALVSAAAWEWARLNQLGPVMAWTMGAVFALLCLVAWCVGLVVMSTPLLWLVVGGVWVVLSAALLRVGVPAWARIAKSLRLLGGFFALWAAWLAVVQARVLGINFLFSVLALVWVADVFAYAFGRMLGGRLFLQKLAPSISPGKTWEGVAGGMLGVVICAVVWRMLDARGMPDAPSLFSHLHVKGAAFMVLAVLFLAAMAVVGDLLESLVKRSAAVKDSSALLPGHGGVLDRIDALLPVLPLAMMLNTL